MEYTVIVLASILIAIMAALILTSKGKEKTPGIVGQAAIVTKDIQGETHGTIKLCGKEWKAAGVDDTMIPKSAKVEVKKVTGDVAVVEIIRF